MRANHSFGACLRKVRHETHHEAEHAVRLIERRDARSGHRQRVAIYRCFLCQGFHVGRPSKRG